MIAGAIAATPSGEGAGKTTRVINSTFYGNTANSAGAIFVGGAVLEVVNSTFLRNAGRVGGAIFATLSTANLKGVILGGAPDQNNCHQSPGAIRDDNFNISDDDSRGFNATDSRNNTNPMLDPAGLANNGGPTETIALEPGSPAIDQIPIADCNRPGFVHGASNYHRPTRRAAARCRRSLV